MSAIKLDKLLHRMAENGLDKIVQHAQHMDSLGVAIQAALPADMARSVVAANLNDAGELIVLCRSSAWASRLRFEKDRLLEAAKSAGQSPTACRVRVAR